MHLPAFVKGWVKRLIIYVDVLISTNILIDYFLLLATCKFLQLHVKRLRMVLASFLGGAGALIVLLPRLSVPVSLLINLGVSILLLLTAFGKTPIRFFTKIVVCFYGISLLFSGVMTVLWFFVFPDGMVVNNGKVYFNISPLLFIGLTVISYTVMKIIYYVTGRHELKQRVYPLTVTVDGRNVDLKAMADTGNSLRDTISRAPVLVAEYAAVEPLIPESFRPMFQKKGDWKEIDQIGKSGWQSRFHLIPFTAVYANGLLPAFKADKILVKGEAKKIDKTFYIAVCNQKLSLGNYNALFNPELLQ